MTAIQPFLAWPGLRHLVLAVLLGLGQTLWFALIFGGANLITHAHTFRVRLYLPGELDLPFVPASVLGYLSIYPLFWMAPFVLRERRELLALTATFALITLVSAPFFLLLPADLAYVSEEVPGQWAGPVRFAKTVALEHNLFPSLHVGMSAVCVLVYAPRAGRLGKSVLWTWSLLIAVSTLLLNQHYLVDVLGGYALAWAGVRWGYRRWTQ